MAATIRYGEQGAPYVTRNGQEEDVAGRRSYLSKDGKGKGRKQLTPSRSSYVSPPIVPADLREVENRENRFGGGSPPGYGAHLEEDGLWETPVFKVHPITQKKEAISGLFFRLWPRHVKVLQKMKLEGWPHIEIVAVAKELRRRQNEEYQREIQLVKQYIETAQQEALQEASNIGEPIPPEGGGPTQEEAPPEGGGPVPEGAPPEAVIPQGGEEMAGAPGPGLEELLARSLSLSRGMSYKEQLQNFRGKFDPRGNRSSDNLAARAQKIKEEASQRTERLSKTQPLPDKPFSFGIIIKGEAGHEPELSQKQLKAEEEKNWARKKPGILGGSLLPETEE